MTLEERVRYVLAGMTEDLKPTPDAYGRVRARYLRRRRRRAAAAGVTVAVVISVVAFAAAGQGAGGGPAASRSDQNFRNVVGWSQRLFDSPPRGAIAGDTAYVAALTTRLLAGQRRGDYAMRAPMSAVKVLFVDDVGPYRVALAAFVKTHPNRGTDWPYAEMRLAARRTASVEELGSAAAVRGFGDALEPFTSFAVIDQGQPEVHVAVAPDGCAFESAAWPAVSDWRPEATGSYLVRTPATLRPEWWRVSCDGMVREMLPGPGSLAPLPMTDAQVAHALSRARGAPDPVRSRELLQQSAQRWGYAVTALPIVVWGGTLSGSTVVVAAPAVGGGWRGEVHSYDESAVYPFSMRTDPADPTGVLVISIGPEASPLLVIAPAAATTVRAVREGSELARAEVRNGAAVLTVPQPGGGVVEAVDTRGSVVGTGEVAGTAGPFVLVSRWHED